MPAAEPSPPDRRARSSLWPPLLASALIYTLMALWFPLRPNVDRAPAGDIRTFAPSLAGGLIFALLLVALFALLMVAARRAHQYGAAARPLRFVLAGSLLMALPLLFAYPINATDVYRYYIRGRITGVYGENPYVAPPATFIGDPFMPLAGEWAGETSPYGPLWEIVASGVAALSGEHLMVGVVLFKGLAVACLLVTAVLISSLLPGGPSRAAYLLLWAWNPALLLTFALNGHNDALMLAWLVAGYWAGRRGNRAAGIGLMALAALTKPVAALAIPFFFLEFLRETPPGRPRLTYAIVALGGAALLAWLAFLPFAGAGGVWRAPVELTARLLREATGGASFSPAVWVYMALGGRAPIEAIGAAFQAIFAVLAIGLLWLAWRGRSALRGAADVFLAYILTALNFRIWYAVWPFPWLLLDAAGMAGERDPKSQQRADYRLRVGLWFLLTSQLSVVVYGHARAFVFGGDQSLAHLIGVPFVFGLPWVLGLLPLRLSRPLHAA